jgi:maspardin
VKKPLATLATLVAAGAAVYLWPVPRQEFRQLSEKVPSEERVSLLKFRTEHQPRFVEAQGKKCEYVAFGQGTDTIVFLHGMTGAYDIWWQQMEPLSERYKVVSLTYPPLDTLAGLAQCVLAAMEAEQVAKAHMVGTSLGGYLLQYLMAQHPERIRKAVLSNTFPPNNILRQKNERLIRLLPLLPDWAVMAFLRKGFVDSIYPAAGYSELVLAYMLEQVSGRMSKAQVVARARAVIEPFGPPDIQAPGIPTIIIEADNDPLVEPALRELLKATYPEAQVHTLHAVGHFPYLNQPREYTQLLHSFFAQ